jgi:uncharacterized protein YwgA
MKPASISLGVKSTLKYLNTRIDKLGRSKMVTEPAIFPVLRKLGEETGKPFTKDRFKGRVRIQKVVFLLKSLGQPEAMDYNYNLYVNGPYSTDLAKDYYSEGNSLKTGSQEVNIPEARMKIVVEADEKGVDFMEALTTTISLATENRSIEDAIKWARDLKPHLASMHWKEVRIFLTAHRSLIQST